jgi:phage shock protein PspC (stress-responsive transcriptional regulator)
MKKTVQINIAGIMLHIDEDAYLVLNNYLDSLKRHFSGNDEGQEIIQDIEYRLIELLQMKLNDQKQVVNIADVNESIDILGHPEDFNQDAGDDETVYTPGERARRFYRDLDNNIAGGVCAGLAAYFNTAPLVFRILFVVLSFPLAGFPALAYILLWIFMPAAETTAQKVEMRGGDFSISDIERSVKREYENIKDNVKDFKNKRAYAHTKNAVGRAGDGVGEIVRFLGRLIMIVVGASFILAGISMVIGFFSMIFFSDMLFFLDHGVRFNGFEHTFMVPDFFNAFMDPNTALVFIMCAFIVIAAPVIALIYWGLKLVIRFDANDRLISLIGGIAWLLSVITVAVILFMEARKFAFSTNVEEHQSFTANAGEIFFINSTEPTDEYSEIEVWDNNLDVYMNAHKPERLYFPADIKLKKSEDNEFRILVERTARGASNKQAIDHANAIEFDWHLEGNRLFISPMFELKGTRLYHFPDIDVNIYVPEGMKICVDKELEKSIDYAYTDGYVWNSEIAGECWMMTDDGLVASDE